MQTTEHIKHVNCDTCGFHEPVKYTTIQVSSGDVYVICDSCMTILGNMDAKHLFAIGFKAGKYAEGKRMEAVAEYDDSPGFKYTEQQFMRDIGELIKRLKFRGTEDAQPE